MEFQISKLICHRILDVFLLSTSNSHSSVYSHVVLAFHGLVIRWFFIILKYQVLGIFCDQNFHDYCKIHENHNIICMEISKYI